MAFTEPEQRARQVDGSGVTARQLNRATLARQMLLERQPVTAAEAVRRVVAMQAQDPAAA